MLMPVCCSPDRPLVFDSSADTLRYLDVLCVTIVSGLTSLLHCFQAAHTPVFLYPCAIAGEILTCRHDSLLFRKHLSMAVCNVTCDRLGRWRCITNALMLAPRRLFPLRNTLERH